MEVHDWDDDYDGDDDDNDDGDNDNNDDEDVEDRAEAREGVTGFLWQRHTVMLPFNQTTHDPTIYDHHHQDHDD